MAETQDDERTRHLDAALDAALSRLAMPEASGDLRERVLARAFHHRSPPKRGRLPLLLAAAAALVAVGVPLAWRSHSPTMKASRSVSEPAPSTVAPQTPPAVEPQGPRVAHARRVSRSSGVRLQRDRSFPRWVAVDEEDEGPEPLPPLPEPQPVVVEELVIAPLELAPLAVVPLSGPEGN